MVRSRLSQASLAPEMGEVWIRPNRKRMVVYGALGLVMAAASADMAIVSTNHWVGWFGLVFFGLGGLYSIWRAMSGGEKGVQLNSQGFAIMTTALKKHYRWNEVRGFQVIAIRGNRFVGFDLSDEARRGKVARVGRALSGVDAMLPGPLAIKPEALVGVMQAWQSYYANRSAS